MKLIPILGQNGKNKFAMVDDEDYDVLIKIKWYQNSKDATNFTNYAMTTFKENGLNKSISMHRLILKIKDGKKWVDHIDKNGFNNQRNNLRIVTPSQNNKYTSGRGSSKYLGVYKMICKRKTRFNTVKEYFYWSPSIKIGSKYKRLGNFPYTSEGEVLAAKAYDIAAKIHHGEFANPNFKN